MIGKRAAGEDAVPVIRSRWLGSAFALALLVGMAILGYFYFRSLNCIDGCGPYHNSAGVADLDGDGDLDVVLSNLRHESELIIWAGATLWINQGEGKFTPRSGNFGGPQTTAGDVDGDGDIDLVRLDYAGIQIHTNYGGEDPIWGDFRVSYGIRPEEDLGYVGSHGSIALGDLNNDGRLDAFVGGCCGVLDTLDGRRTYYPSLSWVWINTLDEDDRLIRQGKSLSALGDLPMRHALGDLDGDGDLDVFAAIQPPKKGGSYVSADRVLLNDGNGNFRDSGQRLAEDGQRLAISDQPGGVYDSLRRLFGQGVGNAGSTAVALGDIDGDGDLDALVGKASGAMAWTNQGGAQGGREGVFADSGQRLPGDPAETVSLADLDGDGHLDALVAGKSEATIWWNDGGGNFRDSGQRLGYTERDALAVGDFNGDGYLDVFSAGYDMGLRLWINQGDGRLEDF